MVQELGVVMAPPPFTAQERIRLEGEAERLESLQADLATVWDALVTGEHGPGLGWHRDAIGSLDSRLAAARALRGGSTRVPTVDRWLDDIELHASGLLAAAQHSLDDRGWPKAEPGLTEPLTFLADKAPLICGQLSAWNFPLWPTLGGAIVLTGLSVEQPMLALIGVAFSILTAKRSRESGRHHAGDPWRLEPGQLVVGGKYSRTSVPLDARLKATPIRSLSLEIGHPDVPSRAGHAVLVCDDPQTVLATIDLWSNFDATRRLAVKRRDDALVVSGTWDSTPAAALISSFGSCVVSGWAADDALMALARRRRRGSLDARTLLHLLARLEDFALVELLAPIRSVPGCFWVPRDEAQRRRDGFTTPRGAFQCAPFSAADDAKLNGWFGAGTAPR